MTLPGGDVRNEEHFRRETTNNLKKSSLNWKSIGKLPKWLELWYFLFGIVRSCKYNYRTVHIFHKIIVNGVNSHSTWNFCMDICSAIFRKYPL